MSSGLSQKCAQLSKGTNFDPHLPNRGADARTAKRLHFFASFFAIHAIQMVAYARMAAEFRDASGNFREDPDQTLRRDVVRTRKAFRRLPVKVPTIKDILVAPSHRNPEVAGNFQQQGARGFPEMAVLVGIDVSGIISHEPAKCLELPVYLLF